MILINNSPVKYIFWGTKKVKSMFYGNNKVYSSTEYIVDGNNLTIINAEYSASEGVLTIL